MQVTIGARCWDGMRIKSLMDAVKVEGISVTEKHRTFWNRLNESAKRINDPKVLSVLSYTVPLMILASGLPPLGLSHAVVRTAGVIGGDAVPAMVAMSSTTKETLMHAFDPLINLIQSLAYPIAGVMIAGGCLFIMVGNRENGMKMLQNAAIGYILVQLSPLLLKLLVGIGAGV